MCLRAGRATSAPISESLRLEIEAAQRESDAVAVLHALNAEHVRALAEGDVAWCSENLSDDFVCTLRDGRRICKTELLSRLEDRVQPDEVKCDEIDVRALDDVVVVVGVMHHLSEAELTLVRYSTVWQLRRERWQAVYAQFTDVARPQRQPPPVEERDWTGRRRRPRPLSRFAPFILARTRKARPSRASSGCP